MSSLLPSTASKRVPAGAQGLAPASVRISYRAVWGGLLLIGILSASVVPSCATKRAPIDVSGRHILTSDWPAAKTSGKHDTPDFDGRNSRRSSCSKKRSGNSAMQVFHCSNEVRSDPKMFMNEYPCDTSSFMHELEKGSGHLEVEGTLMDVAQRHTDYLASTMIPSHSGPDGSTAGSRALAAGYSYEVIGENIASGFDNARDIVFAWMCSPSHRSVLLDCRFSHMGVGVAAVDDGMYITQTMACTTDGSCGLNC
ncbi:hypothetical protein BSKO_04886 [Bryopsis sp. KO-2023]|nr:hypothetical protein BSKO_04886 [Bryopsis sp. KO-2023]